MEKQKEKKNMTFGAHALLACQANAAEPKERGAGLRSMWELQSLTMQIVLGFTL